jgi:hypothetical protein
MQGSRFVRVFAVVFAFCFAQAAAAAEIDLSTCSYGEPPAIPQGDVASEQQMAEAGTAVRAFVGEIQDALACLEKAEKTLGEEITPEQRAEVTQRYNAGVDLLNATATNYNQQVQAFKDR